MSELLTKGSAITFFDGRITLLQIVGVIIVLCAIIMCLKLLKGAVRLVAFTISLVIGAIYLGIVSPKSMAGVAGILKSEGLAAYIEDAEQSSNIKISDDTILLHVGDKWVDIRDIDRFMSSDNKVMMVVDGVSYMVEDEHIAELLQKLR